MATIDNLDISVYNLYALRTKMVEQINRDFRLEEASHIPPHTFVFDIYPKLTELDLLLGLIPVRTPWAYFFPPKKFGLLRRSPFTFSRIAPSFRTLDMEEEEMAMLNAIECHTKEEKQEKEAIAGCLKQLDKLNEWLTFIIGRVGQFLQG